MRHRRFHNLVASGKLECSKCAFTTQGGRGVITRAEVLSSRWGSSSSSFAWQSHERLDFSVEWTVPKTWKVEQRATENFLQLQCSPPVRAATGESPLIHGFSLSAFAYHKRVKAPEPHQLLGSFMDRFNRSVRHSISLRGCSHSPLLQLGSGGLADMVHTTDKDVTAFCQETALRIGGAVCEFDFSPVPTAGVGRAMCRAFYHPNRRFHFVSVFAVPEDEYPLVKDLILTGTSSVKPAFVE